MEAMIKLNGTDISYIYANNRYYIYYKNIQVALILLDELLISDNGFKDYKLLEGLALILYKFQNEQLFGQIDYKG